MYLMLQIMMAHKQILWKGHVLNNIPIMFSCVQSCRGKNAPPMNKIYKFKLQARSVSM